LCAIRGFVDRHLTTKTVIVFTILLLLASWIYPPWVTYGRYASHNWDFIFSTNTGSMRIDLPRLLLIDLIIAVTSGLLAWAISRNSVARRTAARIVFYSIVVLGVAPPMVAVLWGSVVLIQNVQRDAAKREFGTWKIFDPTTVSLVEDYGMSRWSSGNPRYDNFLDKVLLYLGRNPPIRVSIPAHGEHGGKAAFPGQMSPNDIAAIIKKKFFSDDVSPSNFRQIVLFNVELTPLGFELQGFSQYAFGVKVRNDLPRAIQSLRVKASFYDAAGKLIEADSFWLHPDALLHKPTADVLADDGRATVASGASAAFSGFLGVPQLPQGATYRLELVEAHYVPELTDAEVGLQPSSPIPANP
jgi:hypothetical protein